MISPRWTSVEGTYAEYPVKYTHGCVLRFLFVCQQFMINACDSLNEVRQGCYAHNNEI